MKSFPKIDEISTGRIIKLFENTIEKTKLGESLKRKNRISFSKKGKGILRKRIRELPAIPRKEGFVIPMGYLIDESIELNFSGTEPNPFYFLLLNSEMKIYFYQGGKRGIKQIISSCSIKRRYRICAICYWMVDLQKKPLAIRGDIDDFLSILPTLQRKSL